MTLAPIPHTAMYISPRRKVLAPTKSTHVSLNRPVHILGETEVMFSPVRLLYFRVSAMLRTLYHIDLALTKNMAVPNKATSQIM